MFYRRHKMLEPGVHTVSMPGPLTDLVREIQSDLDHNTLMGGRIIDQQVTSRGYTDWNGEPKYTYRSTVTYEVYDTYGY